MFDEVDSALGESLSTLIWDGEIEALTLTANAQPALMATSLAALRALDAEGFAITDAAFVAGHSLGEYPGGGGSSSSISGTARLLRIRWHGDAIGGAGGGGGDGGAAGPRFCHRNRGRRQRERP
ncbi:acyltransferase domain-containing protein [Novosphingobium sp. MW5]|nr:acyltransferase domain-containing protein [Novosphingobium sp. MW5]